MRISCFADEISPKLYEQLRVMQELGIHWMDLRSCWDVGVLQLSDDQITVIRDMAKNAGIGIACIGSPIGKAPLSDPEEKALQQLRRAIHIAKLCDTRYVRIFAYHPGELERAEARKIACGRLAQWAKIAEEEGITLVLEGTKATTCGTGEEIAELLGAINSPNLKLAFDTAAFVAAGERPYTQSLPKVLPWLEYLHIKDCRLGENIRRIAGQGDGQIAQVLTALKDREDLFVSLEPHLSVSGAAGGFSGEPLFRSAHQALVSILSDAGIQYQ